MGDYAWVTLATNDSYSLGALVLAHSLRKSNTTHKLAVLITPAVSQPMREQLQTVFDLVKTVDILDSKDEAHLALMKRPELGITFTKIHCWRLIEFKKCVFLDADTLVVRNCDELFEREEFSAAPDVSWPDCFNSGVFVYKPSVETFNKLLQFAVEKGSFDGGDQGLLNQFFSDWATEDIKKHLPFVYNLTSVAAYSYIPAFKQYGAETRIVHFIGTGKPWLHQLDPTTRTVTPTSGSEHLAPLLQQWWDLFCEKVHPNLSKNLENNNDGMPHPPVEACSNTPVALTSDEPQPSRLIEPCLQYREKDDYRQHNLPYQPFNVRGSSGELLNVEFLLASAVPLEDSVEQQRRDDEEMEEKDIKPEAQEEPKDAERTTETKSEIVDNKVKEKQEEPPTPKDPFDYNTFFPDEKCINNYLEQNVLTYQPFEAPQENPQPQNIPLPRFLTMPEDDQRQKGNTEDVQHQRAPEPLPPLPALPPPSPPLPITTEKPGEVQRQPTSPPPVEKHELSKSKSMTSIPIDVIATKVSSPHVRSTWKSQTNVNVDVNRKYSMPKLKPLLPRQNSRSIQSPIPRVTLYTEFLISADYKDPVDIPKDKVGFVEAELKRSKSETDLKGKFGPLPYIKTPDVEIPEPKKPPLRELDNDAYDLTRCKRQLGNKPRDEKKENITSKLITSSKDKISTLIKKRKSKELSPGDGGEEKPLKRERKECQSHKNNENVDKILKRLWEFSKNYQHYFKINAQNEAKGKFIQPEFNHFRNFVKNQKETTQKGLLGIQDIMTKKMNGTEKKNENIKCNADFGTPKIGCGLDEAEDKNVVVKLNSEVKIQREKNTPAKAPKALIQSPEYSHSTPERCRISNEKQSARPFDQEVPRNKTDIDKLGTDSLSALENISNGRKNTKTPEGIEKHSRNTENYRPTKIEEATENKINQNGCTNRTDNRAEHFSKSTKVKEPITPNERINGSISETPSNERISLPNFSGESPTQISEKTGEDKNQTEEITKPQTDLFSTSDTKQDEKEIENSFNRLRSQISKEAQVTESHELLENAVGDKKTIVTVTQTNGEGCKVQEDEKIEELPSENDKCDPEQIKTQSQADSLGSSITLAVNGEKKDEQLSIAAVNNVRQEITNTMQCQMPLEKLEALRENKMSSDELDSIKQEAAEESHRSLQDSETCNSQKPISQEISSLIAPIEKHTPKGMFTIGSSKRSTEVRKEDSTQSKGNTVSSPSLKQTEEIPQTSKVQDCVPKPDEILCVPDFETPRSSRILTTNPKPDADVTPQAPPSSPKATPRKARTQRKPYENGIKYRSPAGKKIVKTGNSKQCAGIAGAIAQLNLEAGGKIGDSEDTSAAHQEYIRRQNWETGNMDYMGKDSFENIWSKICQTLEGKELDKATESTQSPMTISTEEKTKPKQAAGTETPASLCPEYIDALPSELVMGSVEDDEIIFSKPEMRQTCLTNIKEEEENGGATEGGNVKLSDILNPMEMVRPPTVTEEVTKTPKIAGVEHHLERKLPEEVKPDKKPQLTSIPAVPSDYAEQVNEQIKSDSEFLAPINGIARTQPDELEAEIKPPRLSECTTVAICQPISPFGEPFDVQTATKTPAQKIAEKKRQQKPETSTEPIPLPAPESPTPAESKTVEIPCLPVTAAVADEKQPKAEDTTEADQTSSKDEKQKKGVFSKLLEMVGVAPKAEEASKSVFYDVKEEIPKAEGSEITKPNTNVQEVNKESQSFTPENEIKEMPILPDSKPDIGDGISDQTQVVIDADRTLAPEVKQEWKGSIPDSEKPGPDVKLGNEAGKKKPGSGSRKSDQTPMPKPARNAKSSPQATKNKSPSPLAIPQTPPETALTVATPPPPPEPPKRRNSALLKVDESIPATPPVPEPTEESAEHMKSEIENIIEKAKTEVESILQDPRSVEKEGDESGLINPTKLMIGVESQSTAEDVEELKVTSEEERQRHKDEVASSKLSDQILKAIPPPRRKAISESKPEASGSSGAIPKTPSAEKPKHKPSSIPVPPPRNKGKPSTPAPPKGKTKK